MLVKKTETQYPAVSSVLRILVMHHPPHFFDAKGSIWDLRQGPLTNAEGLAEFLREYRFHLLIAGHRHVIHPALGVSFDLQYEDEDGPQTPLPPHTIQLVAGSPTQLVSKGTPRPSFSCYKVFSEGEHFLVEREVYRLKSSLDTFFKKERGELLVKNLSIL